ncbi:hypothetical protein GIV21_05350 [Pseudomonas syringae]|nr:hypothetical protein [Pseudomonas syringae]
MPDLCSHKRPAGVWSSGAGCQQNTGKKTAPTLPLYLFTAEMPCRFSGIAALPPPASPVIIAF